MWLLMYCVFIAELLSSKKAWATVVNKYAKLSTRSAVRSRNVNQRWARDVRQPMDGCGYITVPIAAAAAATAPGFAWSEQHTHF